MEDAAAMGVFQRTGNLNGEAKRLVGWQWTLQALAFDELENQIPLADVMDLTDMWVIQRRDGAGFLIEAVTVGGRQPLDRDAAVGASVATLPSLTHPACAEWRHQRVGTELNASSPFGHCFEILAKVLLGASQIRSEARAARMDLPREPAGVMAPPSSSATSGFGGDAGWERGSPAFSS